jgi:hypothetical protein
MRAPDATTTEKAAKEAALPSGIVKEEIKDNYEAFYRYPRFYSLCSLAYGVFFYVFHKKESVE